jgi:hypothetical protein
MNHCRGLQGLQTTRGSAGHLIHWRVQLRSQEALLCVEGLNQAGAVGFFGRP